MQSYKVVKIQVLYLFDELRTTKYKLTLLSKKKILNCDLMVVAVSVVVTSFDLIYCWLSSVVVLWSSKLKHQVYGEF